MASETKVIKAKLQRLHLQALSRNDEPVPSIKNRVSNPVERSIPGDYKNKTIEKEENESPLPPPPLPHIKLAKQKQVDTKDIHGDDKKIIKTSRIRTVTPSQAPNVLIKTAQKQKSKQQHERQEEEEEAVSLSLSLSSIPLATTNNARRGRQVKSKTNIEIKYKCTPSYRVIYAKDTGKYELDDSFTQRSDSQSTNVKPITVELQKDQYRISGTKENGTEIKSNWKKIPHHEEEYEYCDLFSKDLTETMGNRVLKI
ncbi:hypothetical protein INT45_014243 [Circinella minor]|uniref:Uncharacterized protein n=1 Tax=Circinella minor TaxID=1195481 RepID=A0A8H7SA48_9FUNG|nr:hypothetical protein INT45_014243 [Circinella minor]